MIDRSSSLTVTAAGMVTGLGYNAPATLAAMRAGVSGIRSKTWPDFESGKRVRCARVSLPQRNGGTALLADLVTPAIAECLINADVTDTQRVPLLLGVARPEQPGRPEAVEQELLPLIYERLGSVPSRASKVYPGDQAGCAFALIEAHRLIESGSAQHVMICGVDTLLDRQAIYAYTAKRRLLTPENFNGFLPGEAGAAVMVAASTANNGGLRISGVGYAQESATITGSKPLRGEGLTQAIKEALGAAGLTMPQVNFRVTDLSGEHYKFKEALFALVRLDQAPREIPLDLWHPSEYLGEIRAAILPCLLAWTWDAFRQGYQPGPNALIHLGSDDGHRFAIVAHAT